MPKKTDPWITDQNVDKSHPRESGSGPMTHFGFKQIPEKEKVNRVVRHFNLVVDKYDFMNTLLSFGIHHLWKRSSIRILKLREGDKVIDVCGGTGDLSLLAAKYIGSSGSVILFDMNRTMMEKGRPKVDNSHFARNILFVQGDAETMPFSDNCFDAVTVGFGIRNFTHLDFGLNEMYRILKPGGKFMCLEFSKPTMPLFRRLYDVYSFTIMPFLGQLFTGSKDAYTYLPESIRLFPSPSQLNRILEEIGFFKVSYERLANGIATIHLAVKDSYKGRLF